MARRIAADRSHGADALARMAVEALCTSPGRDDARRLAAARPGMPVIAHRVAVAWQDLSAGRDPMARLDDESRRLLEQAPDLGQRVATISRSSTVAVLLQAQRPAVDVRRSLPGGEGADTVTVLQEAGVEAHLVEDGTSPRGVVLLGADAVLHDGTVWNKVGSRALADAAGGRVWVATATAKITWHDAAWLQEHAEPQAGFEAVPPAAVDGYITEEGLLGQEDLPAAGTPYREALVALETT